MSNLADVTIGAQMEKTDKAKKDQERQIIIAERMVVKHKKDLEMLTPDREQQIRKQALEEAERVCKKHLCGCDNPCCDIDEAVGKCLWDIKELINKQEKNND